MRHVRLGRTGLSVSRLCLGPMTFGRQCDEATSITAPIVGASRREQLDDVLPAAEKPIDGLLKSRLDELTREYRGVDDPR